MRGLFRFVRIFVLSMFCAGCILPLASAQSNGASLYLNSAKTAASGSEITVDIRINSDVAVNAVQADLNYSSDMLDLTSVTTDTSAFSVTAQNEGSNGQIKIARGAYQPVTGDNLVAVLHFHAKTNGRAIIGFDNGTAAVSADTNTDVLTSRSGSQIDISQAELSPASTQPAAFSGYNQAPANTTLDVASNTAGDPANANSPMEALLLDALNTSLTSPAIY